MIVTEQLTKRYGGLTAVDGLSFTVGPGEVLGFLGPNGAGKSTTMKMIAGFLTPTSGRVSVCGYDEAKRRIGYLPEGAPAWGEMTPAGFLDFIAAVRGLSGERRRARLDEVIARLHLDEVLGQPIETLSKGFKRRVGLAQAILHDPEVLVLDEPTDGLDPNQKHEVRGLIREMAPDKVIVVSTHILEEVHAVCTRAIIIARGRILADDTPEGLEARSPRHNAVRLELEGGATPEMRQALAGIPGVRGVEPDGEGALRLLPAPGALILPAVSRMAAERGWRVAALETETGALDEVFRQVTTAGGAEART